MLATETSQRWMRVQTLYLELLSHAGPCTLPRMDEGSDPVPGAPEPCWPLKPPNDGWGFRPCTWSSWAMLTPESSQGSGASRSTDCRSYSRSLERELKFDRFILVSWGFKDGRQEAQKKNSIAAAMDKYWIIFQLWVEGCGPMKVKIFKLLSHCTAYYQDKRRKHIFCKIILQGRNRCLKIDGWLDCLFRLFQ